MGDMIARVNRLRDAVDAHGQLVYMTKSPSCEDEIVHSPASNYVLQWVFPKCGQRLWVKSTYSLMTDSSRIEIALRRGLFDRRKVRIVLRPEDGQEAFDGALAWIEQTYRNAVNASESESVRNEHLKTIIDEIETNHNERWDE